MEAHEYAQVWFEDEDGMSAVERDWRCMEAMREAAGPGSGLWVACTVAESGLVHVEVITKVHGAVWDVDGPETRSMGQHEADVM